MKWRSLMWILWPSFLMAGVGSAFVFALIDPLDVAIFGYIHLERDVLYAAGFFFFWFVIEDEFKKTRSENKWW